MKIPKCRQCRALVIASFLCFIGCCVTWFFYPSNETAGCAIATGLMFLTILGLVITSPHP